nr:hypothetical protein [Tanacetum cinerariifolium]
MADKYFAEYTEIKVKQFREMLLQHMTNVKMSVAERTRHQRQYDKRVNKRQMQTQKNKVDLGKALDADLVFTKSSWTKSEKKDTSSKLGNDADADNANIKLVYDEEPMVEVQFTAECNIFVKGQQHTKQPEIINEGGVNQYTKKCQVKSRMLDPSLDNKTTESSNQSLESESVFLKKTVAQFQKDFSRIEAHCIALELKCQNQALISAQHVLGKPVLQPLRNQSVVRQPTVFKSKRPIISKSWFASQVDVKNVLSKPVTQHYFPKGSESAFAKPHHIIASSESRNSSKNMPRFSSNDMVHNHYLEEAKKKTQEKDRNSKSSVMPYTSLQNTTNGSKPKPRSNNQTSKSLHVSKCSYVTSNDVPLADHSMNPSPFSDSKHFVFFACHKCVFNANHDACITKFLKEVNSHAMIQSHKTRSSNKPIEQKSHNQKPGRQIFTGHRFSPKIFCFV